MFEKVESVAFNTWRSPPGPPDTSYPLKGDIRGLLINKIPVFTWRGFAAPGENWGFTGILFYGKPLRGEKLLQSSP
jgi:hypothetical protein